MPGWGLDDDLVMVDVRANRPLKLSGPRADSLKVGPQREKTGLKGTNGAVATRALEHPVRATGDRQKRELVPLVDLAGAALDMASAVLCRVVTRHVSSGPVSSTHLDASIAGSFGCSGSFLGARLVCGGDALVSRVAGRVLDCTVGDAGTGVAVTAGLSP